MTKSSQFRLNTKQVELLKINPKRLFSPNFTLIFSPHQQDTRTTTIISKKIDKRAVVRNRLKRQINAIIFPKLPNTPNIHFIIIPKPHTQNQPFQILKSQLLHLIGKISIQPNTTKRENVKNHFQPN